MQLLVVGFIGSFVPEQVAVGPCVVHALVIAGLVFPQGEGDGAVRIAGFDHRDNGADARHRQSPLAALHDKGAEPQGVALCSSRTGS